LVLAFGNNLAYITPVRTAKMSEQDKRDYLSNSWCCWDIRSYFCLVQTSSLSPQAVI